VSLVQVIEISFLVTLSLQATEKHSLVRNYFNKATAMTGFT
jgi:hypothetical protein